MRELGKNIAEFRKMKDMTQAELGQQLNISAQAISKWEKGLSEPDISTLKKLCEIFSCSLDDLTEAHDGGAAEEKPENGEKKTAQTDAQTTAAQPVEPIIISGYCDSCKKPLIKKEEYHIVHDGNGGIQRLLCNKCYAHTQLSRAQGDVAESSSNMRKSIIWSSVAAALLFIFFLIGGIGNKDVGGGILVGFIMGYIAFALVSQLFWGNAVCDLLFFFIRGFRMPGVIFTLDLEGLIFLIAVKVLFAVLAGVLSVLFFLIGLVITAVFAAFAFPFGLVARIREGRKAKAWERECAANYKSLT